MSVYHSLTLRVLLENSEEVYGILYELGCAGIVEEDSLASQDSKTTLIKAYFENHPNLALLTQTASQLSLEPVILTEIGLNSNQFQPAPYDPFHLSGLFWVVPPEGLYLSDKRPPDQVKPIQIKPGVAFGTGRHHTTRLCAQLLEYTINVTKTGMVSLSNHTSLSLLDLGTGSGILAIQAAYLGFQKIDAVDISQEALENAGENCVLNHVSHIQLFDSIQKCSQNYDVVVANILTPTILHLKAELLHCLKPQGFLILSGITDDEYPSILQAFLELKKVKEIVEEDWVGVAFQKLV